MQFSVVILALLPAVAMALPYNPINLPTLAPGTKAPTIPKIERRSFDAAVQTLESSQ